MTPRAASSLQPIAVRTWLVFWLPEEQALPAETAMPARSSCIIWAAPVTPGMRQAPIVAIRGEASATTSPPARRIPSSSRSRSRAAFSCTQRVPSAGAPAPRPRATAPRPSRPPRPPVEPLARPRRLLVPAVVRRGRRREARDQGNRRRPRAEAALPPPHRPHPPLHLDPPRADGRRAGGGPALPPGGPRGPPRDGG